MANSNGNGKALSRADHERNPFSGFPSDPVSLNRLNGLIADRMTLNTTPQLRYRQAQGEADPRRSLADECGYPDARTWSAWDWKKLFDDNALAARVVEIWPLESWQLQPQVYEVEGGEPTAFERAWDELGKSLRGELSFHKDEEGSPVWEHLRRADIVSRIGSYGILFMAFDDGLPLSEPVKGWKEENSFPVKVKGEANDPTSGEEIGKKLANPTFPKGKPTKNAVYNLTVNAEEAKGVKRDEEGKPDPENGKAGKMRLMYMRAFPESQAQVTRFESNKTSPRFGHPVSYLVTFSDPNDTHSGWGVPQNSENVHWSRVIHVADNRLSSEVFGLPACFHVIRPVLDAAKIYGASAEGLWKTAVPFYSFETHPQLGGDVDIDDEGMKDLYENMFNGLQRAFHTRGMSPKALGGTSPDPTGFIEVQIGLICIKISVPVRVFKGSERGELASSQDDAAWNDRLKARQKYYLTPRIIVPFIDRLIALGILPKPTVKEEQEVRDPTKKKPGEAPLGVKGKGAPFVRGAPGGPKGEDEMEEEAPPFAKKPKPSPFPVGNAFCPGEGARDNSCSPGGGSGGNNLKALRHPDVSRVTDDDKAAAENVISESGLGALHYMSREPLLVHKNDDGRVDGAVVADLDDGLAFDFGVSPDAQGQGVGTKLVESVVGFYARNLVKLAKKADMNPEDYDLSAIPTNAAAEKMLGKLGFKKDGESWYIRAREVLTTNSEVRNKIELGKRFGERRPVQDEGAPDDDPAEADALAEEIAAEDQEPEELGEDGEPLPPGKDVYKAPAGYCVWWPDISSQTDMEKAQVMTARVGAYAAYIQGGVEAMIPPRDFMTKFDRMDEEEAEAVMEEAEALVADKEAEDIMKQQQMIDKGLAPDPMVQQDIEMEAAKSGAQPFGGPPGTGGFPPKPGGGPPGAGGFKPGGPPKPGGFSPKPKPPSFNSWCPVS